MHFLRRLLGHGKPKSPLFLFNTLTKAKEEFTRPLHGREVTMYNCGPTVYDTSHIGNLRSYVFADIVHRVLAYNGYAVKQAINITDFGHLSSDADSGHDKMSTALKREGLELTLENMRVLADRYIAEFYRDLRQLNIDTKRIAFPRASDHIAGEIAMVETLEEKGYTYSGVDGVYFDTSRFPEYGKLGAIDIAGLRGGARVATAADKKSPTDFLLWKKDEKIGWESPWGRGFPGWHIECSAMIHATLGKQIDIHTGGIDLMPTHHNNEIAQSESATGKRPFSRFWLHHEFLNISDEKISKSIGNVVNLTTLVEKGYHPLSLRYLFLGAHYRSPLNFTWEALDAAQTSFLKLRRFVDAEGGSGSILSSWQRRMHERFNDDLDTPGVFSTIWEMMKDRKLSGADVRATILDADSVLGLALNKEDVAATKLCRQMFGEPVELVSLPERIRTMVEARESARKEKQWEQADALRKDLQKMHYVIEDTSSGPRLFKKE
ncbi:cysteine--tRNA ligase [Candidatus Kaiserbacteria bacterium]|nr:cysteine--tRNA ligase [Candidatus Kaiserbacteria bacterium]